MVGGGVVAAGPVEEIEGGDPGFVVVEAVVVLESGPGGAALGRAGGVEEVEGGALVGVGVASVVVDAGQVLGFGEEPDDEGVVGGEEILDDRDRYRAVAGYFAELPVEGDAAEYTGTALMRSVRQALHLFMDERIWRRIQLNGMAKDFSWKGPAAEYTKVYQAALTLRGVGQAARNQMSVTTSN